MASVASLTASSETAQDIAAAFMKFQDPVFEQATEITALISELFAISSALLELKTANNDPSHYRRRGRIESEQYTAVLSLEHTFKDVQRLFGGLARQFYNSAREAYQAVWQNIQDHFLDEGGFPLVRRFEYYRMFLVDIIAIIEGYSASGGYRDNKYHVEKILRIQEAGLPVDFSNMAIGTPRQPSWERMRPYGLVPVPNRPPSPRDFRRPPSPLTIGNEDHGLPPAPVPPASPTTTTATTSSQSSHRPISNRHWIVNVFGQGRPTTVFQSTGFESSCQGEDMPHASSRLSADYENLLELPFEDGFLKIRFYVRSHDRRARLLCRMDRGGQRIQSSHPITQLRIVRELSCIQICREDRRGRLVLWTNLRFPSYERLVLFYCTFLALKSQDEANPIRELQDHILYDEREVFSAIIIDDTFQHALRIFKDINSGGVRLQASALSGPMKKAPIWTAFITHQIFSSRWNQVPEPRKVHLADLTRYVFTGSYIPQLGPHGEHELCFLKAKGQQVVHKHTRLRS
ncbi:hypothetical protein MMC26_001827 [Xylographa opegraphella]|nr:hypothetical protein [Xylographa opegraphella]